MTYKIKLQLKIVKKKLRKTKGDKEEPAKTLHP